MLRNYFTTNFRSLWKNKFHTAINISGLALGMSCAIIIFTIVRFELSFDNHHDNAERTYRVVAVYNKSEYTAGLPYPLAEAIRQDFPDIEYATITDANMSPPVIGISKNKSGSKILFKEMHAAFADPDFFKIFNYKWLQGNPETALTRPKTVVLAKSVAVKYFGDAPAVNEVISYNGVYDLTVSGVVQDPPQNTDLPFSLIITNAEGADHHNTESWDSSSGGINCYVQLRPGVDVAAFQEKMTGWHMKYFSNDLEEGKARSYFLQALKDVHFDKRFGNFNRTTTEESLLALALIGALLLLTACINFVNLNTVLIVNRSKEVGVRKVMGSGKSNLVFQFLGETLLISMLALAISLPLTELALTNLDSVMGYTLKFRPLADGWRTLFIIFVPFFVTILAGLYPALSLANFQPIQALKNKMYNASGGVNFRRALIGFQLMISQMLIVCTIIIIQQMDFFTSQPMGLNSSSVVEFDLPSRSVDSKRFKERLQNIPGVELITMSNTGATANNSWGGGFEATVNGQIVKGDAQVKFTDPDFLKTYHLSLAAGSDATSTDSSYNFLVNESFVRALGIQANEDAIGTPVSYWGTRKGLIRGVIKDFHANSLREAIQPIIFMPDKNFFNLMAVRLQTKDTREVMNKIELEWKNAFSEYVFQYSFLDDTIRNYYIEEQRTSKLFTTFAIIAVLIGSIGLMGLVSFMVTKRTKEVGIRKTLGASVSGIMTLFSKEFFVLIGISFALAAPFAAFVMQKWLENFAFHITPGVTTFAAGAVLSLVIVMLTVGFIAYKAAIANPVTSLRNE